MSTSPNGHLPEGAVLLTLETLRKAATVAVRCPILSERLAQEVYVFVRPIRRVEYLALLPPRPPSAEEWPEDRALWAQRYEAWLATLDEEARRARQAATNTVTYKLLALALIDPRVTAEQAEAFAEDADVIAVEVLRISGLLESPKDAEVAPATAQGA